MVRIYRVEKKKMEYPEGDTVQDLANLFGYACGWAESETLILDRFTFVNDSDGEPIYEDDVLEVHYKGEEPMPLGFPNPLIGAVAFDMATWQVENRIGDFYITIEEILRLADSLHVRVIGNRHEDAELAKALPHKEEDEEEPE